MWFQSFVLFGTSGLDGGLIYIVENFSPRLSATLLAIMAAHAVSAYLWRLVWIAAPYEAPDPSLPLLTLLRAHYQNLFKTLAPIITFYFLVTAVFSALMFLSLTLIF